MQHDARTQKNFPIIIHSIHPPPVRWLCGAPMPAPSPPVAARIDYRTDPGQYRHWKLAVDAPVARLSLAIAEDGGIRPGYQLKLHSYDLGVDIFMLGRSSHAWKVNFCKFTNETRNGMEDSSRYSGIKFVAAVNGTCAGGGYELALACDAIVLVDDRSCAVSLPEVPLLGVLPGTGGLTRLTDKRHVRHDLADIFCTSVEGVRGQRALDWRLVDQIAKPAQFAAAVAACAARLGAGSLPPPHAPRGPATPMPAAPPPAAAAAPRCPYRRGPARSPQTSRPSRPEARHGGRWPWRANSTTPSCTCAPTSWTSAPGCSRPKAMPPPCWPATPPCWRTRSTGWCARPSACCAAPWPAWMCLRAACSR